MVLKGGRMATIKLNDSLVNSIKEIVKKTKIFVDEEDFIQQAIMKQLVKFKDV